ncbi:MAG: transposase, partial [Myxococcales bacterium]|nr:transposase [Myxococcales bacterium]
MSQTRKPRHQLTDPQWETVADLFPTGNFKTGRRPRNRRVILNAIFWVLRTGAPWRDLPGEYGPWSTAWDVCDRWTEASMVGAMLCRLRTLAFRHEADPDSTSS